MGSFGLGLVLSFTDNASAGMRSATQTFQQMSSMADAVSSSVNNSMANLVTACYALDSVGNTLVDIGSSVVGTFLNVSQEVIDTGMTMMGFRMQLRALYGDNAFEDKMKSIQEYAKNSVFEVKGLMKAVVTMKAVGIEAMDAVTSSSGNTTQTLMDYASDIAAMFPNMRNAYGTGVNAAMGALKEYIAEGNALSLKRGAGLDITGLLGEDKGATIEERTRQVADLVEQLGIAGYTEKLMGTPTQQLSRMQDVLFNAMSDIADSGVFEKYTALLTKAANWVHNLSEDTDRYNGIISILGGTITSVLSPLESILDSLISKADALIDWAIANPVLAQNILKTVAAIGAFLVVGGLFLKFVSSIGMASAGFNFLKTLPSLLGTVGAGFTKLVFKALPFLALAGLVYYAWTENLFGIRDTVTEAFNDIKDTFSILKDAWADFELSEENYNLAESLGILPLIEALLQFRYYWDFFVEGFKTGFQEFFKSLEEIVGIFGIDLSGIFKTVGEFLKSLFDIGQEDKWKNIGETAGKLAGIALSLLAIYKVLSLFKPLVGLFSGGIPFIGGGKGGATTANPFSGITGLFTSLASMKPTTVLKGMLNLGIIIGGLTLIAAAVMAVSPFLAGLTDMQSFLEVVACIAILGVVGMALAKLSQMVGTIPVSTVALGLANMAIMIGGMSALLTIIGLVSMIPFDTGKALQIVVIIGILGVLGAALSGIATIIGAIPVALVALGLANIAIIMGGLTALYLAIGAVAAIGISASSVMEIVEVISVLAVMGSILAALGAVIGLIPFPIVLAGIANIVTVVGALTGLALAISEALPALGSNISEFVVTLKPAFEAFNMLKGLDMAGIGSFFTSFGAFMLELSGDKIIGFFTGGTDLTQVAHQLVEFATIAKGAFETFSQIPTGSVGSLTSAIGTLEALGSDSITSLVENNTLSRMGEQFTSFANSLRTAFTDFPEIDDGMISTLTACTTESMTILTNFANSGANIGSSLMQAIANSISSQTSVVKNALQTALSSINVTATPNVTLTYSPTISTAGMVGLSTGGYVKETGIAVLHPDEVVVNDDTTRRLQEFLNHQQGASSSSSSSSSSSYGNGEVHNDYSVTFSQGSVVIQLANATESELEKAADKLMKIIERRQQLKAMATRA